MIFIENSGKAKQKKTDKKIKNKINQADEKRERCVAVQHRKKTDAVVNGFSRRKQIKHDRMKQNFHHPCANKKNIQK